MKKLLLVFAHPDDESFASGGTVAKFVAGGGEVHLLCATRGEAGNGGSYRVMSPDALGVIRQKELEEAGTILGISTVTILDYKDGELAKQHAGELEDKIYRHIVEVLPDIIITFEPGGITNHPDHVKISLSTTYAFQKYAKDVALERGDLVVHIGQRDKKSFDQASLDEKTMEEPRLYYACMPESVALYLKKQKSIPAESFGKPWKGTLDKLVTTVIDIAKFRTKKAKAILAHKSQQEDTDRFFSPSRQPLLDQEYFMLRMQGMHEVFMGKFDRIANRL